MLSGYLPGYGVHGSGSRSGSGRGAAKKIASDLCSSLALSQCHLIRRRIRFWGHSVALGVGVYSPWCSRAPAVGSSPRPLLKGLHGFPGHQKLQSQKEGQVKKSSFVESEGILALATWATMEDEIENMVVQNNWNQTFMVSRANMRTIPSTNRLRHFGAKDRQAPILFGQ